MSRFSVKMTAVGLVAVGLVLGLAGQPNLGQLARQAGGSLGWGYGPVTTDASQAKPPLTHATHSAVPVITVSETWNPKQKFSFARPVRKHAHATSAKSGAVASDAIASDMADDTATATDDDSLTQPARRRAMTPYVGAGVAQAGTEVAEAALYESEVSGPDLGDSPKVVIVPEAIEEDTTVVPAAAEAPRRQPTQFESAEPLISDDVKSVPEEEPVEVEPAGPAKTVGDDVDSTFTSLGDMLPDDEPSDFGHQVETAGKVLRSVEPHVAARMLRRGAEEVTANETKNSSSTGQTRNSDDHFNNDRRRDSDLFGNRDNGSRSGSDERFGRSPAQSSSRDRFDKNDRYAERDTYSDRRSPRASDADLFGDRDDRISRRSSRDARRWDESAGVFDGTPRRSADLFGDNRSSDRSGRSSTETTFADMTSGAAQPVASYDDSDGSSAGMVLSWETPRNVNVGQTAICRLKVNNASSQPAHRVEVSVALDNRARVEWSEPAHTEDVDQLVWQLGTIEAGEQKTIRLGIVPISEGSLQPRAVVTATRAAMANIDIMRPELDLVVLGPSESMLGQAETYTVEIKNGGSGPAMDVAIELALPPGLNHPQGDRLSYRVGTLEPGAMRHVQVPLTMVDGGTQRLVASAGCAGMTPTSVERTIEVAKPRLQVALDGPKLRYVDRKAIYSVTIHNPGPAPADNVRLVEDIPEGFRFVQATAGAMFNPDTRQVAWFVGRLDPETTARMGLELIPTETGEQHISAVVQADAGVTNGAETVTRVEGTSVVVLDVVDRDDPVEASGETSYRVRVTNVGSIAAHNVQLAVQVPEEMKATALDGPTDGRVDGAVALFDALAALPPGESRTYTVRVTCQRSGDARFQAFVRTAENPKPVMEEEATRVYAD